MTDSPGPIAIHGSFDATGIRKDSRIGIVYIINIFAGIYGLNGNTLRRLLMKRYRILVHELFFRKRLPLFEIRQICFFHERAESIGCLRHTIRQGVGFQDGAFRPLISGTSFSETVCTFCSSMPSTVIITKYGPPGILG